MNLKKLFNTRDLGGFPAEGGVIKKGKLIRSGKLYKLPEKTVCALKNLGVNTVIDLRIFTEIDDAPDTLWEGVKYYHLPVLCTATTGITREKSMRKTMAIESRRIKDEFGNADNYMIEMYRTVLFNEQSKSMLSKALRLIIENDGCVLWHCSGGKDRAGILAMLVEGLLGVDEKHILQDYAASHNFQRARFFWNRAGLVIAPLYMRFKRILFGMMAAKPQYMKVPVEEIKNKYGSIRGYCMQELGITDRDVEIMKEKYVQAI